MRSHAFTATSCGKMKNISFFFYSLVAPNHPLSPIFLSIFSYHGCMYRLGERVYCLRRFLTFGQIIVEISLSYTYILIHVRFIHPRCECVKEIFRGCHMFVCFGSVTAFVPRCQLPREDLRRAPLAPRSLVTPGPYLSSCSLPPPYLSHASSFLCRCLKRALKILH